MTPIFPPSAEVKAVQEPKPKPPVEIVTDDTIAAQYDADVESWGERVQSAGVRLCLWFNENGAEFECEETQ